MNIRDDRSVGDAVDSLLSLAVTASLGWKKTLMPLFDADAIAQLAQEKGADADALRRRVEDAIRASDRLRIADLSQQPDGGTSLYKRRLADARPDLGPDAVDALASRWFYRSRWLGVEEGVAVPRYFVRYGGEGATPVPISLFRRRTTADGFVDEVLKDVDDWRADVRGAVSHAALFSLDSDLEEVTADEALQFVEMVRRREYVPFRPRPRER
jgi:hypothetical protein